MDALVNDLRYAARGLRKSAAFTAIAILTLALGIGANTAIFSIADSLIARPIRGLKDVDRLVAIDIGQKGRTSPADYADWSRLSQAFESTTAYRQRNGNVSGGGPAERIYVTEAARTFFATLAADAARGAAFQPGDAAAEASALLSYGFWQRRFGGDPGVVGRTIRIDDRPYAIAGVMGPDFDMPAPTDVWVPLLLTAAQQIDRATPLLRVVGRLKPSATIAGAQAEMSGIARQLETAYPATNRNRRVRVAPLAEVVQGTITRAAIFLLLGLVVVVLLVACANIAGLQLARATSRQRELALRTALGASGWRIAQLVLVETAVVAVFGGVLGVVLASICIDALLRSMPGEIARLIPGFLQIGIDGRALAFTAAVTLVSAALAAVAPAWRSTRAHPSESLKDARASSAPQGLRTVFVVGQLAVAFVMLVVSATFVTGLQRLLRLGQLHDPEHVLVFSVTLPPARYPDADMQSRFHSGLLARLAALSGADDVASFSTIPLSNNGVTWSAIQVDGVPPPGSTPRSGVVVQRVSPAYFRLMRIGLKRGRLLEASDRAGSVPVVLVSEGLAQRYWPQENPVGREIKLDKMASRLVIAGVVADVLYDWTNRLPEPTVYLPVAQAPEADAQFAIRSSGDPAPFAKAARAELAAVDPLVPAFDVMRLSDAIRQSLSGSSQMIVMMEILAAVALLIAVVGLYGVVAYLVAARTREFGVRLALGARRSDVLGLVMLHAATLATIGLAVGIVLALMMTRVVSGLAFGTTGSNVGVWIGVACTLTAVTLLASYVPARRAMQADPMAALRVE